MINKKYRTFTPSSELISSLNSGSPTIISSLNSSNWSNGDEEERIVDVAEKKNFDLIVIGSRGIDSVKEAFLGSVSHYITHRSKVPVLIIK